MDNNSFMEIVERLQQIKDNKNSNLNMDSIIISNKYETFRYDFHNDVGENDIRSLSKTVVSLAIGIAIDKGVQLNGKAISEDLEVWPYFKPIINLEHKENEKRLEKLKLKHLINLTPGFDESLGFSSKDLRDRPLDHLLDYVFNYRMSHEPGENFVYSNVGPYLVSALIQEALGVTLADWIDDLLFKPLRITHFGWKKHGKYNVGSSGLILSIEDVHKIGRLLIDDGMIDNNQIAPKEWVRLMKSPLTITPKMYDEKRVFPKYAYGYGLWICKDGNYYVDGTDGQYIIILPKNDLCIITFGHQSDMKPITECFRHLL